MKREVIRQAINNNLQLIIGSVIAVTVWLFVNTLGWIGAGILWIVVVVAVIAAYVLREPSSTKTPDVTKSPTPPDLPKPHTPPPICSSGPHEVEGGGTHHIELNVRKGDHIVGRLSEVDGYDFDWYIVDEKNLVLVESGENFDPVAEGYDTNAHTVDWEVKSKAPWFLVLDLPHKQYARSIKVHLRHQLDA